MLFRFTFAFHLKWKAPDALKNFSFVGIFQQLLRSFTKIRCLNNTSLQGKAKNIFDNIYSFFVVHQKMRKTWQKYQESSF